VVKLNVFVLRDRTFRRCVRFASVTSHASAASTTVYVPALAAPAFLLEVEAVAVKAVRRRG